MKFVVLLVVAVVVFIRQGEEASMVHELSLPRTVHGGMMLFSAQAMQPFFETALRSATERYPLHLINQFAGSSGALW